MSSFVKKTADWFDDRIGIKELVEKNLTGYGVPIKSTGVPFCLGGLALMIFGVQLITGILLLVHYVPTTAGAFESVQRITLEVPFGWFIRGVHSYGATVMIAAVMLHAFRVFWFCEYRSPRELHWMTGIILLGMTLGLAFSGYLLPWTQLSYWGSTVGTETLRGMPWGDEMVIMLRGGEAVGEPTLHRFFAAHVVLMPLALMGFIAFHLYLVRRTGQGGPPTIKPTDPKVPFFPGHVAKELLLLAAVMVGITLLILYGPHHHEEPADPFNTPAHIKPEWYFLASYQFLKVVSPEWLALALQGLFAALVFFWPFLDRKGERDIKQRPVLLVVSMAVIVGLIGFSYWGAIS